MPNLDELLQDTMLWAANPGDFPFGIREPHPVLAGDDYDVVSHIPLVGSSLERELCGSVLERIAANAVWSYGEPHCTSSNGREVVRIDSVNCCVRDMNYMPMPVLEEIEWGPVTIFSETLGCEVELPLGEEFRLRKRYIPEGRIEESDSGFWQLPANVDQSWEMIFGYEIPLFSNCQPKPLKSACWNDPNLMTSPVAMVSPRAEGKGDYNTLCLPALRVLVCASLVCCKERRDFDPGGLFGGGRIYPYLMAISNLPLAWLKAQVVLARPEKTACTAMRGEQMSPTIASYLFADRNSKPSLGPPFPYWDILFDYYQENPYPGEYEMVRIDTSEGARSNDEATTKVPGPPPVWDKRKVEKVRGQGEFDNIHFAPRMIVPADIRAANPGLWKMDEITMAPFCVHDCLHMHWRWGTADTEKWNLGWADDQQPYAVAGAPLVPANQRVTLEMQSQVKCAYHAEARPVPAGKWQVVLHHGAAYALSAGQTASLMSDGLTYLNSNGSRPIVFARHSWALFYWCLRYTFQGPAQVPRLSWDEGKLMELRKL